MKCPYCGGETFAAHQKCYIDVIVDGDNMFLSNLQEGGADKSIYESEDPYGPYACLECGAEFDELDERQFPLHGPVQTWREDNPVVFRDHLREMVKDALGEERYAELTDDQVSLILDIVAAEPTPCKLDALDAYRKIWRG